MIETHIKQLFGQDRYYSPYYISGMKYDNQYIDNDTIMYETIVRFKRWFEDDPLSMYSVKLKVEFLYNKLIKT